MALLKQGILGGISGKIGNLVGSSWKGLPVIKTKPLSVANPRTAGQILQRDKMSNTVAVATALLSSFIKPLWDRFSSNMSGYNAFVAANIEAFGQPVPTHLPFTQFSRGKMSAPAIFETECVSGTGVFSIQVSNALTDQFAQLTDDLYVAAMDRTTAEVHGFAAVGKRDDGTVSFTWPSETPIGRQFYIWLAFRRVDGTVVSNAYAYSFTVA